MEIYQLKTFLIVAHEGHLTRAAERLHISQPAVSGQIKNLEQELGISLFDRTHGGMQPTRAAQTLIPHVERILDAAQILTWEAGKLNGKLTGRLTLGVILHPDFIRLGELTQRLLEEHPLLEIDIRHRTSDNAVPSLRSREIDVSFYLGRGIPADLSALELSEVRYWVVASSVWREKLSVATWEDVGRMPWVSTMRGGSHHQMTDTLFASRRLTLQNLIVADQESTIVNLVRAGVGLGLVREELAREAAESGQIIVWDKESARSTLNLVYLKSRENDPMIAIAREVTSRVWTIGSSSEKLV